MRPTYVSSSISKLLGYGVQEAVAKPMEEVSTPASFKSAMDAPKEELDIENTEQKDPSGSLDFQASVIESAMQEPRRPLLC